VEGLRLQKMTITSSESGILSDLIVGWRSEWSENGWDWLTPPFITFRPMISKWGKSARKWFWKICHEIKRTPEGTGVSIFRSGLKITLLSWNVSLLVTSLASKGRHFGTLQNIRTSVTDRLNVIPVAEFQNCYERWKHRLRRCVDSQGNHCEGDNVK